MNQEEFGKFIKQIRKNNNLTQKQLADKYNLPIHMHFCENETEKKDIINSLSLQKNIIKKSRDLQMVTFYSAMIQC